MDYLEEDLEELESIEEEPKSKKAQLIRYSKNLIKGNLKITLFISNQSYNYGELTAIYKKESKELYIGLEPLSIEPKGINFYANYIYNLFINNHFQTYSQDNNIKGYYGIIKNEYLGTIQDVVIK